MLHFDYKNGRPESSDLVNDVALDRSCVDGLPTNDKEELIETLLGYLEYLDAFDVYAQTILLFSIGKWPYYEFWNQPTHKYH